MRGMAVGLLGGAVAVQSLPQLPEAWLLGALLALWLLLLRPCRPGPLRAAGAAFGLGFLYTVLIAAQALEQRLPAVLDGQRLRLEGEVLGLPQPTETGQRFLFQPDQAAGFKGRLPPALRLRIECRDSHVRPAPGERWQLYLKLRSPRGLRNPASFDYEAWLHAARIGGLGSCIDHPGNRRLAPASDPGIEGLRARLLAALHQAIESWPHGGIVQALALGEASAITAAEWKLLQLTGTIHLVSVSGLHISLVALGVRALVPPLFQLWPGLAGGSWVATVAAVLAFSAALGYAVLSGFAVPAQRSVAMVAVWLLAELQGHRYAPTQVLAVALMVVLLLDPLSVLGNGFWLSFGAVLLLLLAGAPVAVRQPGAWRWLKPQLALSLGLVPALLLLGGEVPLTSLPANLLAVPFVAAVTTPLAVIGLLAELLLEGGGRWLWQAAALSLRPLWLWLECLQTLGGAGWTPPVAGHPGFIALLVVTLLGLSPAGLAGRLSALLLLLLALAPPSPRLAPGAFALAVLDVGQGTAAVVTTRGHTLVYDTGPRYSERFEAGGAILAPYLRSQGRRAVDTLVLSHGDLDHSGGVPGLLAALPVRRILTSVPTRFPAGRAEACRAGQAWHWDGVGFRFLHPDDSPQWRGNDGSCVLRIDGPHGSALLPGDIEARAETRLLETRSAAGPVTLVLAPHHGSRTSSTPAWVNTLEPRWVVFTVGHRNRFGLPRPEVLRRWEATGAVLLDSARHGAIEFQFDGSGQAPWRARVEGRRYWQP
jgi:competence protein ComEC